jgi:hypothetical protein
MDDTDPFKDPCEDFLQTHFPVPADDKLRQSLWLRTTGVLRRQRRLKHIGFVAALAACYATGLGSMWLWMPSSPGRGTPQSVAITAPSPAPQPVVPDDRTPAVVLELQALNSDADRPDLFRLAGHRYVKETGDLAAALRCYRHYLDKSSEKDLAISAEEDDFLLMALKMARQKEKDHEKNGG